jgi:uncharacterized protein YigE (DUF2233 family)
MGDDYPPIPPSHTLYHCHMKYPSLIQAISVILLITVAGCAHRSSAIDSQALSYADQNYVIVSVDLRHESLSLHWHNPDTSLAYGTIENLRQWGETHRRRLIFAANAGIYDRQQAPLGLFVENGRTRVPLNLVRGNPSAGNFSLQPNGVFAIYTDGHAAVHTTNDFKKLNQPVQWATQSGPMLVIDGHINTQFIHNSASMKWRSGVCAPTPYRVIFAISEAPVNFHQFATLFRQKLGCRDALYLDGTISQFYVDGIGYVGAPAFMIKPYAGMFAIFVGPATDPDKKR